MEVPALCVTLLLHVVLAAEAPNSKGQIYDGAFPHIVPSRLQFFQNESLTVDCEDSDELHDWTVRWKLKRCRASHHSSSATSCFTVEQADPSHSGQYWCEDELGGRSDAVNITVVAGEVILDIPPPVVEGHNVTLRCQTKNTLHLIADFYKDGGHVGTGYKGEMTIHSVSTFDQGLYKCSISGAGESPQSWLTVRAPQSLHSPSSSPPTLLWILISVSVAAQLLVLVGLHCEKHKGTKPGFPEERDVYSSVYYRSVRAETSD